MTENKRFTVRDWQIGMEINDDKTGKDYNRLTDICDLLNELNNENQILKKTNKMTESTYHALQKKFHNWDISLSKCRKENNTLKKENEQLKQSYENLKHHHSNLHDECTELECDKDRFYNDILALEKENEQLKQHLKRVLQEEYDKCDIPVWRGQYVRNLAEKLGVEIK